MAAKFAPWVLLTLLSIMNLSFSEFSISLSDPMIEKEKKEWKCRLRKWFGSFITNFGTWLILVLGLFQKVFWPTVSWNWYFDQGKLLLYLSLNDKNLQQWKLGTIYEYIFNLLMEDLTNRIRTIIFISFFVSTWPFLHSMYRVSS